MSHAYRMSPQPDPARLMFMSFSGDGCSVQHCCSKTRHASLARRRCSHLYHPQRRSASPCSSVSPSVPRALLVHPGEISRQIQDEGAFRSRGMPDQAIAFDPGAQPTMNPLLRLSTMNVEHPIYRQLFMVEHTLPPPIDALAARRKKLGGEQQHLRSKLARRRAPNLRGRSAEPSPLHFESAQT